MSTTEPMTPLTPTANAEAMVDLAAIGHNVRVLREHAGSSQVMAVVKADGYGHGASQVARAALAAGAAEIGVATLEEGDKTSTDLIKRADERLFEAKRAGRNRVC